MGWRRDARGMKRIVLQLAIYETDFALYCHELSRPSPPTITQCRGSRRGMAKLFLALSTCYAVTMSTPARVQDQALLLGGGLGVVRFWINRRQSWVFQPVRWHATSTEIDQLPWPDSCGESMLQVPSNASLRGRRITFTSTGFSMPYVGWTMAPRVHGPRSFVHRIINRKVWLFVLVHVLFWCDFLLAITKTDFLKRDGDIHSRHCVRKVIAQGPSSRRRKES